MTFSNFFLVDEFTGTDVQVLTANHPLHDAVRIAGSLHQPTVPLADVQRPPGHAMPIAVRWWRPGLVEGKGMFEVNLGTPPQKSTLVKISAATPHVHMTTAHEMGHVMDHLLKVQLIGAGHVTKEKDLYASEALHTALQPWWAAVQATRVYEDLHTTQRNREWFDAVTQGSADDSPSECFACSYAQLVAVDSGDATLLKQLSGLQSAKSPRYWKDEDFKLICEALRAVFSKLGW